MLLSFLVITSPAHDHLPIVWIVYTYDSEHGITEDIPLAFPILWRNSSSWRGTNVSRVVTKIGKYFKLQLIMGEGALWDFQWHPMISKYAWKYVLLYKLLLHWNTF